MLLFKLGFILNYPNEEGRKLDFRKRIGDLKDAVTMFNSSYRGVKELKVLEVEKQEIHFLFSMFEGNQGFEMNGRHLAFFSKRLYENGWSNYTSIPSKLFKTSYIQNATAEFCNKYTQISTFPDRFISMWSDENFHQNISDDDAIKLMRNLIEMQNIGDEETIKRNRDTLSSIKSILFKWIKGL